ncbi:MAG TPA: DedA family protein [Stellaceae bacterium]|nr:DedA family protein [Stellaceae bacterium]
MLESFLVEAQRYIAEYGYSAIFLGLFLESFGLPTPGESLMIAGALLASAGKLDIYWLLTICWVAAVAGDNIGYAIGAKGGRLLVLRYGPRFRIRHEHIERVEGFFHRHGGAVVLFARFVVVLRQLNGIVAGTMGMSWWHFLFYNALGAALWVGFWGTLAYWLGKRFHLLLDAVSTAEPFAVAAAIVTAAIVLTYFWIRGRRKKRQRRRAPRKA